MTTFARTEIAAMLRRARRCGPHERCELLEWAAAAYPTSRVVRRHRIAALLRVGDMEAADALLAQSIARDPDDRWFTLMRVRRLAERGRLDEASCDLRVVLPSFGHHRGALVLAADIARRRGQGARAVRLLEQAVGAHPHDDAIRVRLVEAHVASGDARRAAAELRRVREPSPEVRSLVLEAEGRFRDAVVELETGIQLTDAERAEVRLGRLIELAERMGDSQAVYDLARRLDPGRHVARARLARVLLGMGRIGPAIVQAFHGRRDPRARVRSLCVIAVGASVLGRGRLARRALDRLRTVDDPSEATELADCWLRGLRGRVLLDQRDPRKVGRDPAPKRLESMLEAAVGVFDRAMVPRGLTPAEAADLQQHRAVCLAGLGRSAEAERALGRSMAMRHAA